MTGDNTGSASATNGAAPAAPAAEDGRRPGSRGAPLGGAAALFAGTGEMRARARALDWAATPLGPVEGWPTTLRTAVRLMLDAPVATSLWVGAEYTLLYNDAYAPILGAKHPRALGRSGAAVWDELWPALEPQFARVRAGGPPVFADDALLRMERLAGGRAEDAWFTYALSALTEEGTDDRPGDCLAVYNVAIEVTARMRAQQAVAAERARLFETFQRVPSFVSVVTGPDHVLEYANEAYYALVGRRDIVGRPVWDALPDARAQGFEAMLDRVRDTGMPVVGREAPLRLARVPGAEPEERVVDFVFQALKDADGVVWGVMGYGSDVTEHVRARREGERVLAASEEARARAEESERRFREMADAAPVLIWTAGTDARCDWFNRPWLAFTGRPLEAELGDGWMERVHPADLDRCRDTYVGAFHARAPFSAEYRLRRHDGAYRWLLDNAVPRFAADGTFVGFVGTCIDVTDQRLAREAAEAAAVQLQDQALELELANQQLHENAAQLEATNDELQGAAMALEERTADAERAHAEADAANRRLAFLAHASERLASSLDYETTVTQVVALAVPAVADWAAFTVDAGDGTLRLVAIHHPDPERAAFARAISRRYPIRADEPAGAARVLRTGEPELMPEIPDAMLAAVAQDAEHLAMLRAIGFRSLMTVPVISQGRVLGTLGFGIGESDRRFGAEDLAFAQELARRAGTAVDHARLYEEAEAARREAERERARAVGILEAMADAHFVLDAAFRFVSVNAASERNLAHTREQLLGRVIWEAFPAAVGTIFEASYRRVVEERVEVHFTGAYADGVLDIVPEVDAYPTVDGGVAVFWRDVAPRLRAEAELRASEQRLRDVFEQAPVAVAVMTGPEHVYTAVSPMYARTPGLGRQLLGRSMREAFPEVVGTGYIEAMDRVYHTGVPFSATERSVVLARPDDGVLEEHFFNIGYQPLRDGAGRVYAVASVAYDVTEHVVARRELEAARAEAERQRAAAEAANAVKSQFLSTMSHELRTPLNAIAGYADLLTLGIRGVLTEPQRHDMERIRRANQHLMSLVTDILNFARIDAGQIEFRVVDLEVASIVADLEPLVAPQLLAKGLSFDHDACAPDTPDRPHLVRADPEKLRQILLNLLTNAVKFTDAGGRVTLACETDAGAGVIRVRVADTGRGIPPDQLERIFEPFVQVDRHRTHESQQGVGLGLAISRDLARGMGGDLTVESTPGAGSTFTLTLPRA